MRHPVIPRCKVLREQRARRKAAVDRLARFESSEPKYDWLRPTVFLQPHRPLPADALQPIPEPKPGFVAEVRRLLGY
jgi:hypothetical protein